MFLAIRIAFVAIAALVVGMALATLLMAVCGASFPGGLFGPVPGLSTFEAVLSGAVAVVGMLSVFAAGVELIERDR